jgi:hypothetical protein
VSQSLEPTSSVPAPTASLRVRWLGSRVLGWPTLAKLGMWYLLLLLPTLYFKYSYLNSLAEEGVLAAVDTGSVVSSLSRYITLFDADFVEVLVVVAVLFAIGHLLLRISVDVLVALSVLVCMLVSAGNWLSFQVIGSLLNADNLEIAFSWLKEHPETVTADLGGKLLLLSAGGLVLLALLWTTACFLAVRGGVSERNAPFLARMTVGTALVLQLVAATGAIYDVIHPRHEAGTSRGYWSSTVTSLRGAEHWAPLALTLPSESTIESHYERVAYDSSTVPSAGTRDEPIVRIPPERRIPRHIVFISLETAARKYYPLLDNPELPTFSRMASRGVASDYHLSTNPATTWAIYSMLTGTYPRRGRSLLDYGDFDSDGLASVLGAHGFETTFIDSYKIDWQSGFHRDHNSRMVKDLGFKSIEDITTDSVRHTSGEPFDMAVARERRSLARALDRIDDARAHHAHAFVFIATILGHFPWNAPAAAKSHSGAAKLAVIGRTLDSLMGEFLASIDKRGLSDSIIVIVTGDHGLRAKGEFGSLGETMRHSYSIRLASSIMACGSGTSPPTWTSRQRSTTSWASHPARSCCTARACSILRSRGARHSCSTIRCAPSMATTRMDGSSSITRSRERHGPNAPPEVWRVPHRRNTHPVCLRRSHSMRAWRKRLIAPLAFSILRPPTFCRDEPK